MTTMHFICTPSSSKLSDRSAIQKEQTTS